MTYIVTFFAVFFLDIINAWYIKAISEERPLAASLWAVLVTLLTSIAVINYVSDYIMLIPALLGAFTGTYVGIILRKFIPG